MFVGPQYNFPIYQKTPSIRYFLLSTKRTGSTFIAQKLWETGCFGSPVEYDEHRIPNYLDELYRTRTSSNGVFGFKTVKPSTPYKLKLNPTHLIYVDRRDEVDRAISEVICNINQKWFHFDASPIDPNIRHLFNYHDIHNAIINARNDKKLFEEYITSSKLPAFRIFYEDYNDTTVQNVADFLGITLHKKHVELPQIFKSNCDFKEEWKSEFMSWSALRELNSLTAST